MFYVLSFEISLKHSLSHTTITTIFLDFRYNYFNFLTIIIHPKIYWYKFYNTCYIALLMYLIRAYLPY